jgi:HEAT repeat protein
VVGLGAVVFVATFVTASGVRAGTRRCLDHLGPLRAALSVRHDPPDRAHVERMCRDAEQALIEVAVTPARAMERLRAIHALGGYGTDRTRHALAGLAAEQGESASLRRAALLALGRTGPEHAIAIRTARTALRDSDAHVRLVAVEQLARIAGGRRDLVSHRRVEREAFVRAALDRVLEASTATVAP